MSRPATRSPAQQSPNGDEASAPVIPRVPGAAWRIPRRYVLQEILGQGAYGTVCWAYDREGERNVAIKQVRNLFRHPEDCKRTLRELLILRQLHHECVVQLYDVFLPRGTVHQFQEIFIVEEMCDSDVRKLLSSDVVLEMQHLQFMLYNLLKGLKYLGSAGVIHRDLQPGNILVNQNCEVKICDFNLACVVDEEPDGAAAAVEETQAAADEPREVTHPIVPSTIRATRQLTQRVVTRWYRAPEVILLQGYTKAIDMWSVGCVFGELLEMLEGGKAVDDRSALFPGTHCYPLSPNPRRGRERGEDLLGLIFGLLGTPTDAEVERLERRDAQQYVRRFPASGGQGLQARLPWVDGPAFDIITRMLCFDAEARLTVADALEHELFADIREESEEQVAAAPIVLAMEREQSLDEHLLRHHFIQEARHFGSPVWEGTVGGA